MKALIFENKVVDLSSTPFEVHSSMSWVDCDNTIEIGFTYNGTDFIANEVLDDSAYTIKADAEKYLAATDWYVIRKTERDIAIPEEVATKRLEAVEVLNGINN